jgi:hypothetical protein
VLTPAACYPVYPLVASRGEVPATGLLFDVASDCFRREPSRDLDRLQSFRMREYVCVGTPEQIDAFRRRWMIRAQDLAGQLRLPYRMDSASDAFFGRGGKLMAMSQIEQALKFELLVPVRSTDDPTACMSFNYHRDHFGTTWSLRNAAGQVMHTGCVAFGMDRLALAMFATHGLEVARWPSEVRKALRAFEIFRHVAAAVPAEEAGYWSVRVDNDERPAVPRQQPSDRSGEAHQIGDVAAVDQSRARYAASDHARSEHERIGTLGRGAPQADAAERGVLQQYLLIAGIEAGLRRPRRFEHLDLRSAEQSVQHRYGDEDPVAVTQKTLGFDDRPRVRRRRDVQIGNILVAKRLRHQHRRVSAEGRVDIPAGKIATGGVGVARPHRRTNEQDGADADAATLQKVTIFRQTGRRRVTGQPGEGAQPEPAIVGRESARQQRRDGFDIGFIDLTAAQSRYGGSHSR